MKICFMHPESKGILAGGFLYNRKIVEGLKKLGNQVTLLKHDLSETLEANKIADKINAQNFDCVVQDELGFKLYTKINKSLTKKTPVISLVHVLSSLLPTNKKQALEEEKSYIKTTHASVFVSEGSRQDCINLLASRPLSKVIYPGRDHLNMKPSKTSKDGSDKFELLFVGNLYAHKGLRDLIEALSLSSPLLSQVDWKLNIVGSYEVDPQEFSDLKRLVKDTKLEPNVDFLGQLPDGELEKAYASCDIFCLPSHYESLGIVAIEAQANGKPVVATRVGGLSEAVKDGSSGFLSQVGNPKQLANNILHTIQQYQKGHDFFTPSRAHFESFPVWEDSAAQFGSFIKELVEHQKKV